MSNIETSYDQFGRVYQVFDAAGDSSYTSDGIVNGYNACAYLTTIADAVRYGADPRVIYRRIVAMTAEDVYAALAAEAEEEEDEQPDWQL